MFTDKVVKLSASSLKPVTALVSRQYIFGQLDYPKPYLDPTLVWLFVSF